MNWILNFKGHSLFRISWKQTSNIKPEIKISQKAGNQKYGEIDQRVVKHFCEDLENREILDLKGAVILNKDPANLIVGEGLPGAHRPCCQVYVIAVPDVDAGPEVQLVEDNKIF